MEGLTRFLTLTLVSRARRAEDRLVLYIIAPLNRLAVHSRTYSERKGHSRSHVGKQEGLVITSESHDMRNYKINNMMFLNSRNIMILRSSKKLNDKMLKLFKILVKIEHVYQLKLLSTIKILISLKSVVESELS